MPARKLKPATETGVHFDLGRAMPLLNSRSEDVVKKTSRRLHVRLWHAGTAKMTEILRAAGASPEVLNMLEPIVDTRKIV